MSIVSRSRTGTVLSGPACPLLAQSVASCSSTSHVPVSTLSITSISSISKSSAPRSLPSLKACLSPLSPHTQSVLLKCFRPQIVVHSTTPCARGQAPAVSMACAKGSQAENDSPGSYNTLEAHQVFLDIDLEFVPLGLMSTEKKVHTKLSAISCSFWLYRVPCHLLLQSHSLESVSVSMGGQLSSP